MAGGPGGGPLLANPYRLPCDAAPVASHQLACRGLPACLASRPYVVGAVG